MCQYITLITVRCLRISGQLETLPSALIDEDASIIWGDVALAQEYGADVRQTERCISTARAPRAARVSARPWRRPLPRLRPQLTAMSTWSRRSLLEFQTESATATAAIECFE